METLKGGGTLTDENTNGWPKYQRLVIYRLDHLDEKVDRVLKEQADQRVEFAHAKRKNGFWGGLAGAITAAIAVIVASLRG